MPQLQLALDFTGLEDALRVARAAAGFFDVIEAGTPLIKSVGMDAVRRLRAEFPGKLLVADTKTADTGALEARMALEAGADIMTVLACAPPETLSSAVEAARRLGGMVAVDLLGVDDPAAAAAAAGEAGADIVVFHLGIDQQRAGRRVDPGAVGRVADAFRGKVAVAGGLNPDIIGELGRAGVRADILIVGGYVTRSSDPAVAARRLREAVERWM